MKKSIPFLVAFFFISTYSFSQAFSEKIDAIIQQHYEQNSDIAFSVGFIQNDSITYMSYGSKSRKSTVEINEHSIFEIASITKILTSNLIAQAVMGKKIDINDFIDDYLPAGYVLQKGVANRITIADLASHQSGLPDIDFGALIAANPQQPVSAVKESTLTDLVNNCSEILDHGSYRYSTLGYVLLGQILEGVYEQSYAEIIKTKMLNPLNMTETLTKNFEVENRTTGYNPDGGEQAFFEWNITGPAGLVKSNAADMMKFVGAVLENENPIAKAALLSERKVYEKEGRVIGLGLNIIGEEGNAIYLKTGDSMGQSSIMAYNRDKNWGLVILINQRNHQLRQKLFNEIYEQVLK